MQIHSDLPAAARAGAIEKLAASLRGDCIGCEACDGLCDALVATLTVPGLVLGDFDA